MNKLTRGVLWLFIAIPFIMFAISVVNNQFLTTEMENPLGKKNRYEVFGFAPHWTINRLDNVDWSVLTTMAYFGVPVGGNGELDREDVGYTTISTPRAQEVFAKARKSGTRIVLTLTQMNNEDIRALMDDSEASKKSIRQAVEVIKDNDFDGVNIDYEYVGNPGDSYRNKFTNYVRNFKAALEKAVPGSQLTVSVYASSVREPKIYDIAKVAENSDAIFMMAYDFATAASDHVIPTSPLYGHKEGKYWYDVSTAVEDFLSVMPAEKLILGLPWYGYNYPVSEPGVKVSKYTGYSYYYWYRGRRYLGHSGAPKAAAQTYALASQNVDEKTGWDDNGKVGWRAYREDGIWRMIFVEDEKSLSIKYKFAKDNNLAGVGVWALGFDNGTTEMWQLLSREFGTQVALAQ